MAALRPEDICSDMAFLERGKTTAAVIAKDEEVEVDQIRARGCGKSWQRSLDWPLASTPLVLVQRLKITPAEWGREMALRDRRE